MKNLFFLVKPIDASVCSDEMLFLAARAEKNESYVEVKASKAQLKAVGFCSGTTVMKSYIAETLDGMSRLPMDTPVTNMVTISNENQEQAVLVMAGKTKALENYQDPTLDKLFSSIGLSKEAVLTCSKALLSPNFFGKIFRDGVELTNFSYGGEEYCVPQKLSSACYRQEEMYFATADAKEMIKEVLDLPCSLNEDCEELQEHLKRMGFQRQSLLDDADVIAERFLDDHDSNVADNVQMEVAVNTELYKG